MTPAPHAETLTLPNEIQGGPPVSIVLDYLAKTLRRGGNVTPLTQQQILVIVFLAAANGEPRTHQQINEMLVTAGSRTLRYGLVKVLINRMRFNLSGIVRIPNVRGHGYALRGIG